MIPYGCQEITEKDIEAVVEVLRSDFITQGPVVPRFERAVADYCGAGYGVAVSSGTAALHLACRALDIGPGDVVWTSPITFVASANCVRFCGGRVDFVDIDPATANISVEHLAEKLARTRREGEQLPKAVIPVHFAGQSCDMAAIAALAEEYGFHVIEDASHAIGGRYRGDPVGRGRYSDITVFSFHPVKIITTGEGGMAVANDEDFAERMSRLRSHGIVRDPTRMSREADGPWYYEQAELGYNYRMTEIQAALGLSQLTRLDDYVARRNELAQHYDEAFRSLPIRPLSVSSIASSTYHLYVVRVRAEIQRDLHEQLRAEGIGVNLHYIPLYRQPDYVSFGIAASNFPEAEAYYREAVTLPIYPTMNESEVETVIQALKRGTGS